MTLIQPLLAFAFRASTNQFRLHSFLTSLPPLAVGTLSRTAGEGGPSRERWWVRGLAEHHLGQSDDTHAGRFETLPRGAGDDDPGRLVTVHA